MSIARPIAEDPYAKMPSVPSFKLVSDDMADGAQIDLRFVSPIAEAEAGDVSPHLAWSGFPDETKSFVVTCFDPDAPTPSGFWHWLVADIPVTVTELPTGSGNPAGSLPSGAYGVRSDHGITDYCGPYPPSGDHPHRYFFVVHAVDVESLGVAPEAGGTVLSFNLAFHTLARAILTPTFQH